MRDYLNRSAAALAWLDTVEPPDAATRAVSFVDVVAPLMTLDMSDLRALGFDGGLFGDYEGGFGQRVLIARPAIGLPQGLLTILVAPGETHRAVLWSPDHDSAFRLWVDSQEVPLPIDERGDSLVDPPGTWSDEHLFALDIIAINHPGQDWTKIPGTGQIRGLLLYDAHTRHQRLELPRDDETWTSPTADRHGDAVLIYADSAARTSGTPARVVSPPG